MIPVQYRKWAIMAIIAIPLLYIFLGSIFFHNREVKMRNRFTAEISNRTSAFDEMWKVISQKGKVAVKNDSSFYRNVAKAMEPRADGPGIMMKWVQESNPNINYDQVASLYRDLSRAIEAQRGSFHERERLLADLKREHDDLLGSFPGNIVAGILGKSHLDYKPITSDRTDDVIRTGKDNDVKVF